MRLHHAAARALALTLTITGCTGQVGGEGLETAENDLRTGSLAAERSDESPLGLPDNHQGSEAVLLEDPVLQEDALLIEQHESFERVTVRSNSLEFTLRGESPLEPGMVVGGGTGGGYLRRIESVEQDGERVVVRTSDAAISDMFAELELEIAYRPRLQFQRAGVGRRPAGIGRLREPLGDGSCHDVSPCQVSGSADERRLNAAGGGHARSISCDFGADGSFDIDADLEVDFDADFQVSLRRRNFYVHSRGDANAYVQVNGEGEVEGSCEADFAEAIFNNAHWTLLRFNVLGIPGEVYAYPVLRGEVTATASGSFEARVGLTAHDERTIGWQRGRWTNEVDRGFEFSQHAQAEASASANANLDIGIGLGVSLGADLVVVAAQAGIEGALFARVDGSYEASATFSTETGVLDCPWSFDVNASLMAEGRAYARFGIWPFIWRDEETWGPATVHDFGPLLSDSGNYCDGETRCVPQTCETHGCGAHDDGCGGTIDCGPCASETCIPTTCARRGVVCGVTSDGCRGQLDCGSCYPHIEACESIGEGWCDRDQDCSVDGRCLDGTPVHR